MKGSHHCDAEMGLRMSARCRSCRAAIIKWPGVNVTHCFRRVAASINWMGIDVILCWDIVASYAEVSMVTTTERRKMKLTVATSNVTTAEAEQETHQGEEKNRQDDKDNGGPVDSTRKAGDFQAI